MEQQVHRNTYTIGSRYLSVFQRTSVRGKSNNLRVLLEKLFADEPSDFENIFQVKMYPAAKKRGPQLTIKIGNQNVTPLRLQQMCGGGTLHSISDEVSATNPSCQPELHVDDMNKRADRLVAGLFLSMLLVTGEKIQFVHLLDQCIEAIYSKISDPVVRSRALIELILSSLSFPITIAGSDISDRLSPPSFDEYLRLIEYYITTYIFSPCNVDLDYKELRYYLGSTVSGLFRFYTEHERVVLFLIYKMCVRMLRSQVMDLVSVCQVFLENLGSLCREYPGFDVVCLSTGMTDALRIYNKFVHSSLSQSANHCFTRYPSIEPFIDMISASGYDNLFKLLEKSEDIELSTSIVNNECDWRWKNAFTTQLEYIDTFVRLLRILKSANTAINPNFTHRALNNPFVRKTLQENQIVHVLNQQGIKRLLFRPGRPQPLKYSI